MNVTENSEFKDGEVVTVTCLPGFNLKGPSRMECKMGDWDVDNSFPECTPGDEKIMNFSQNFSHQYDR